MSYLQLKEGDEMVQAFMQHCDYPSPTFDQAQQAGKYLFDVFSGNQPRDLGCMLHCGGTVYMFGVSFLHDHPDVPDPVFDAGSGTLEERFAAALQPMVTSHGAVGAAIPWK